MNSESGTRRRGVFLAVLAAALWGVSGAFAQFLFDRRSVSPEWLVSARMPVAGALLLLFFAPKRGDALWSFWKNRRDGTRLLAFSFFGMLAVQYTYFAAIKHSNAATATVIQSAGPVLIVLWFVLRLRRRPTRRECAALALASAGTLLLVTHGRLTTLSISGAAFLWGMAAAVALALYSMLPVELVKKHSASALNGWAMLIGGAVFWMAHPVWRVTGVWDAPAVFSLLFIIVFGTLLPFHLYMVAVRLAGGQTTSMLLCAEPLSATLVSVLWLGTSFGLPDWTGAACILSTVFLLAESKKD